MTSEEGKTVVQETSNAEFVDLLRDEINKGGGFVPFIGSGISSPSGILMGLQFDEYLAYTVFLCVADKESIRKADPTQDRRWDLRRDGWPKQPTTKQVGIARKWIRGQFDKICDECGFRALPEGEAEIQSLELAFTSYKPEDLAKALTCPLLPRILRSPHCSVDQETLKRLLPFFGSEGLVRGGYSVPGISPTSADAIIERAIRALFDWRATLNFLAELKLVDDTLLVEECELAVIDGFNVHITRGRKPNLTHNMLCHLAGPARFRVILTTNFDSLIEDAFRELKERMEVISVSIKGTLPDPEIVHARNTVVKMHGTLSETRADFSLDESPSRENKRRFFHYVRGAYPDERNKGFLPAQILVCGYSGADNRCVEMIKYVLDAGGPGARVYWICHNEGDLERVSHIFRESAYKDDDIESRIIVTVTERCDLLLYELFQRLCLSLQGGGPSCQYSHHVPPDVSRQEHDNPHAAKEAERIVNGVCWFAEPTPNGTSGRKLLVVDGEVGVLATLRQVLRILTGEKKASAIWLELQDYQDTYCAAYDLLQIISNRLGLFQLGYADLLPARFIEKQRKTIHRLQESNQVGDQELTENWHKHIEFLIDHYFSIVPGKWVIVLYGRNGPGGCTGWDESSFWKDEEYGTQNGSGHFPPFIKAVCELGFHVIYAPYSEPLKRQNEKKPDKLRHVLGRQFADVTLAELDNCDYPEKIPPHCQRSLESSFAPQNKFPGMIVYRCKWPARRPDSLKIIDFDSSMERLFENWVSSHANRHFEPQPHAATSTAEIAASSPDGVLGAAIDPPTASDTKLYLQNLQFLYAATLFRRARHYSSFLDKGVLPYPHFLNVVGRDNDWERNKALRQHLADLNEIGFFYQKPGGFAWTYRDFRLGLRRMIDSLPADELKKYNIEPFVEWRSHYHYWIGDWYLQAFYTTGHAIPLIEGLYHLYQTIRHLGSFRANAGVKDTERAWRRYRLWRKAGCDMAKALRVGGDAIRLWFGPPLLQAWFPPKHSGKDWLEAFIRDIEVGLDNLLAPIPEPHSPSLRKHAASVTKVLQEELLQLTLRAGNQGRIKHYEGQGASMQPVLQEDLPKDLCELIKFPPKTDDALFGDGPQPIRDLCLEIGKHLSEDLAAGCLDSRRLTDAIANWQRSQLQRDFSDSYFFYLIQQLNERAFLFLRDAKLRQLLNLNRRRDKEEEVKELLGLTNKVKGRWICVTILVNNALEFCRLLHPTLDAFEGKERVKSLCLYGVALARLGRFYEGHRRLNEANALLSKINVSASDGDVLLGILELRRAEAHILEGMLLGELRVPKEELHFSNGMSNKLPLPEEEGDSWNGMSKTHLCERYSIKLPCSQELWRGQDDRLRRLQVAKLDDGWCALERAERLLSGRLRSSHWWSRLCVLKLRCLAEHSMEKAGFRPLAHRIQCQPFNQICELLCKGLAGCQEESRASSRLRLVDLALRTAHNLTPDNLTWGKAALKTLEQIAEPILKDGYRQEYPQISHYAKNINGFLEKWKREVG